MSDTGRTTKLTVEADAGPAKRGLGEVKAAAVDMAQGVEAAGQRAGKGVEGIGAGADKAAAKLEQADNRIIASIQRRTAALEAAGKGERAYQEALISSRGGDVSKFQPYLDALDKADRAQKVASGSLDKMGISAGQTTAALRQLPAQFTDIITSLQGGQKPLSVFLQQGGQIKDSFGGVGEAAKALGGYVLGLVNPFTLAAAAAGVLAYAYNQGANEGQAFQRTVILTGGAAGVTAGQLSDMAAAVNKLGGGTTGRAAEILNQMAQSGLIGAANLTQFTAAALKLEKVGGPAAEETAKAFEALGKAPFEAAVKLNETTGAFSATVIKQIKALEDQGRAIDAARVAQVAYFNAAAGRTPELENNLGVIEHAWIDLKEAIKAAGNELLKIGRIEGLDQQIQNLEISIGRLQRLGEGGGLLGLLAGKLIESDREQQAALQKRAATEAESAKATGERVRQAKALADFEKDSDKYLSNSAKSQQAIAKATQDAIRGGPEALAQLATRIQAIQQQFDPGVNLQLIKDAEAQRLEILKRGEAEITTLRAKGALGVREEIEAQTQQEVASIAIRRSALEQELVLAKGRQNSEKEVAALRGQLALLDAQRVTAQINGAAKVTVLLEKQKNAALEVIAAQRELAASEQDAYDREKDAAIAAITRSTQAYADSIRDEAGQLEIEVSLLGASNEVRAARIAQYRIELDLKKRLKEIDDAQGLSDAERIRLGDQARAVAAQASAQATTRAYLDEWQKTSDQISQSLTDALIRGFEGGKGLAQNLADTLKNIFSTLILRPVVQAIVQGGTGTFLNAAGQLVASGAGSGSSNFGALTNGASLAGTLYNAGTGSGLAGTAISYGSNAAVYSGSAYGTGFGTSQSAALAAQEAGITSSAGASSLAAYAGYAAAAALVAYKANADYNAGFTTTQARDVGRSTFGLSGTFEDLQAGLLKGLGVSDRLASILSGSTAVAKIIGLSAPKVEGRNIVGSIGADGFSGNLDIRTRAQGGLFRSDDVQHILDPLTGDVTRAISDTSANVREQAKKYGEALGLPVEQISSVVRSFNADVTLNEPEFQRKTGESDAELSRRQSAEVAKRIQGELNKYSNDLFETFSASLSGISNLGETAAQTIERVAGNLLSINGVLDQIGLTALASTVDGGKAAQTLSDLFGGVSGLTQAAGTYYDQFFTSAEKSANATKQLGAALDQVGLKLPDTRDQFRALVDGLDLTTAAGQAQFQVLLTISGAFADLVPASESAAAAVRSVSDVMREREGLEKQLLQLQGDTAALRKLERDALDPSNKALYDRIQALTDSQAAEKAAADAVAATTAAALQAAQDATNKANAIAQERSGLDRQLLELQGNTAAIRALDRAAVSEGNRDLFDRIAALKDEQAAAVAAAAASDALAAAQKAAADESARLAAQIASQRDSLETQLLKLQGNTAELRARERAGIDASNQALYDQINALTDQQAALAETTRLTNLFAQSVAGIGQGLQQAFADLGSAIDTQRATVTQEADTSLVALTSQADAAKSAFDQVASSLGSLVDSLQGTVATLLGSLDPATTRIQALATLNAALTMARAGGSIDAASVQNAAGIAGRIDNNGFATSLDAKRETLRTAALIGNVASAAQTQIDQAKAQSDAQLAAIAAGTEAVTKSRDDQLRALDDQLAQAKKQYEALTGINTGVQTVAGAVQALAQAMAAYGAVTGKATGTAVPKNVALQSGGQFAYASSTGAVATGAVGASFADITIQGVTGNVYTAQTAKEWVQAMLAAGDYAGIRDRAILEGIDSSSVDDLLGVPRGTSLAFALSNGLPAFATGSDFVPADMVAQIHKGERILPAADNAQLMSILAGNGRDEALVAEIRRLNARIDQMAQQQQAQGDSIAISAAKTARLLDKFDIDGMPAVRT